MSKQRPPGKRAGMTDQQRRFVEELLVDNNATAAAIRAGYSKRSASRRALELRHNPLVAAAIAAARAAQSKRTLITADRVLEELGRVAFADLAGAFGDDGALLPLADMPEDLRRAIGGVETEELYEGRGAEREHVGVTRKVKFWDKVSALRELADHFGMKKPSKVALTDPDGNESRVVFVVPANSREAPELATSQPPALPGKGSQP